MQVVVAEDQCCNLHNNSDGFFTTFIPCFVVTAIVSFDLKSNLLFS